MYVHIGVPCPCLLPLDLADRPVCARSGELLWYVGLGEAVELECHVDAFPHNDLHFSWTFRPDLDGPDDDASMPTTETELTESVLPVFQIFEVHSKNKKFSFSC